MVEVILRLPSPQYILIKIYISFKNFGFFLNRTICAIFAYGSDLDEAKATPFAYGSDLADLDNVVCNNLLIR